MQNSPRDKISPEFWSWLQQHPDASTAAIIRIETFSPEIERTVKDAGCSIRRRLHLLPSLAVQGSANALMELAAEPWVQRIEPDQAVRAL